MAQRAGDILSSCALFARVQPAGRSRLLAMGRLRRFAKGESICRQDDPCAGVFVVGAGLVRIYKLAPNGKEHVLHLAGPGTTFLEVATILGVPCPANAEALEDSVCLQLPAEPFARALREDHGLCLSLLSGMAMRARQLVGLLEDIVLRDALSRVANYLLSASAEQGETINLPSLKRHLASHLNLTSETLSRCLRQLIDGGLIESGENQAMRIVDAEGLREVGEGVFPRV